METVITAGIALVFVLSMVLLKTILAKNVNSSSSENFNKKSKESDLRQKYHQLNKLSAQIRI